VMSTARWESSWPPPGEIPTLVDAAGGEDG
jgi:hypothetical protein